MRFRFYKLLRPKVGIVIFAVLFGKGIALGIAAASFLSSFEHRKKTVKRYSGKPGLLLFAKSNKRRNAQKSSLIKNEMVENN